MKRGFGSSPIWTWSDCGWRRGRFVPTGRFHEIGLAAGFDELSLALIRAAELSGQRVHHKLSCGQRQRVALAADPRSCSWTSPSGP